jgi:hypothetical protein
MFPQERECSMSEVSSPREPKCFNRFREAIKSNLKGKAFADYVNHEWSMSPLTLYTNILQFRREGNFIPRDIFKSVAKLSLETRKVAVHTSYQKNAVSGKPLYRRSSDRYLPASELSKLTGLSEEMIRSLGVRGEVKRRLPNTGNSSFIYSMNGVNEYKAKVEAEKSQKTPKPAWNPFSDAEKEALSLGINAGLGIKDLVLAVQSINPDRKDTSVRSRLLFLRSKNLISAETYTHILKGVSETTEVETSRVEPAAVTVPEVDPSVLTSLKNFEDARTLYDLWRKNPKLVNMTAEEILEAIFS